MNSYVNEFMLIGDFVCFGVFEDKMNSFMFFDCGLILCVKRGFFSGKVGVRV